MLNTDTKLLINKRLLDVWLKECDHIDYNLSLFSLENEDHMFLAQLYFKDSSIRNGKIIAVWNYNSYSFFIEKNEDKKRLSLPWFEPDLSNPKKLLNKIKTYIVFS